jgi:hypothetical protein
VRKTVVEEFERWFWAGVADEPHYRDRFRGIPDGIGKAWSR